MPSKKTLRIKSDPTAGYVYNNGSTIKLELSPPIPIPSGTVIRLLTSNIWYVFPNISNTFNNTTLYFESPIGTARSIVLKKGLYDLPAIQEEISEELDNMDLPQDLFIFDGNDATGTVDVQINSTTASINLSTSPNNIMQTMGFTNVGSLGPPTIAGEFYEGFNRATINKLTEILVHANFVNGTYDNGNGATDIISSIPILATTGPGNLQVYEGRYPNEVSINKNILSSITVYITDQDNSPLDTNGEIFTLYFELIFP